MNKRPTIGDDTFVVKSRDIISSDMDNETVMMSIEKGEYYGMNSVGSCIWALLEKPNTIDTLCAQLQKQFAVSNQECRQDVSKFVHDLLEKNLIQVSES